jgi:hypothetical protein
MFTKEGQNGHRWIVIKRDLQRWITNEQKLNKYKYYDE